MAKKFLKSHVVSLRLGDREYEYLDGLVDGYHFDSVSMVIRFLIRESMDRPELFDSVRLFDALVRR